jgi:hypothetical protein
MRVHREFIDVLRHHRLESLEAVMAFQGGRLIRDIPGRSTRRIELPSADGRPLVVFLKRYEPDQVGLRERLRCWLGQAEPREAACEWRMIHTLHARGFGTATPIATGEAAAGTRAVRSFVMTAEICGGQPADMFWRTHDRASRRALIAAVAGFTRRFHDEGFIHKDYYLAHIFVVERDGHLDLHLIDLQRVMGPARFRRRWIVKDLGGLAFSAVRSGVSRTNMLRFYKKCFDVGRLDADDKKLIRKIRARVARISRHTPRYGEPPPVLTPPSADAQTN